ncbi:4'-phosphopantetheinyl transferase superfamily protein [Nocardioides sp. TRM66260-LWL]|uniref:4'-phosphopantetheinyl transferase family protein n=1 Tax=Nocardioides sp. TRM66260-LWL TaxID=2874478 RepID=UPI001CC3A803|nr:4'-phosphopantetheinyl transferase superfamily protein [Nocardioides sp. TRM66260-LWL]MBZ5734694.1 4'-phosphopantetheinyl transferase superfamily protein [Nocardioides sp. TRM66260-LWL]
MREQRGPLDADDERRLLPAEEAWLARAVPRRRREAATARRLAREALAALGVEDAPAHALLPGPLGAPSWPPGVVGSLAHTDRLVVAAVARSRPGLRGVGVDVEPDEPLPPDVVPVVLSEAEQRLVADLLGPDRLLFCAKEAAYKAWAPDRATRHLDPLEVAVTAADDAGFVAVLPDGATVTGRWTIDAGLLLAAARW